MARNNNFDDSDRRPLFPQCLAYASSNKLQCSGIPATAKNASRGTRREEGKRESGEQKWNVEKSASEKSKLEREAEIKRTVKTVPRLYKIRRRFSAAFCALLNHASQLEKLCTLSGTVSMPLTNKSRGKSVITRDYRL